MDEFSVGFRLGVSRLARTALSALADAIEGSGADALFVADASSTMVHPGDPFVTLGALSALTERVTLACLATPLDERPPSLLAKVVAGLDVCSGGRAGAFLRPSARGSDLEALGEGLEVLRAMLRLPDASMNGKVYSIRQAWNEPKALRSEPTPVGLLVPHTWQGGDELALLQLGARFCEQCVVELDDRDDVEAVVGEFAAACRSSGRLPKSASLCALVSYDEGRADEVLTRVRNFKHAGGDGAIYDVTLPLSSDDLRVLVEATRALGT